MVETFRDFIDKINKYFAFSRKEIFGLVIVILALSFMVGFNDGQPEFHFNFWIRNFIGVFFIIVLGVLVSESSKRFWALHKGYKVTFNPWYIGLFIGLIITLLSNGYLFFLAYGGITLIMLKTHRLGKFRYGLSYSDLGVIALMGPAANILLALFFKLFMFLPNTFFVEKAIMINVALALFNMFPIPPLSGSNVLFASMAFYVFSLGALVGLGIMIIKTTILASLIGALLMSVIFFVAYKVVVEKVL